MKFPPLFRRRSLVVPTLTGWLLILLVLGLGTTYLFRGIADFLTVNEPAGGEHLVIEGWMNKDELDQALDYFNSKGYQTAIIVGGPITNDFRGIDTSFAQRAAGYLYGKGLDEARTAVIATPHSAQNRTFLNAVMTREWFYQRGMQPQRLDVFSSQVHTRRSRDLYQLAFGESVQVGVIPARQSDFDARHWWRSSGTGKYVAVEFFGWLMVACCFDPGEPGSHLEKWGIEKKPRTEQN